MDSLSGSYAECAQLMTRTTYYADKHDCEAYLALFTEDAVLRVNGKELSGKEAMKSFFTSRSKDRITCHTMSPTIVDFDDDENGRGAAYFQVYEAQSFEADDFPYPLRPATAVGEYKTKYRLTDEGWRISELTIQAYFRKITE